MFTVGKIRFRPKMSEVVYPRYRWLVIASLCGMQAMAVAILVAPATLIGDISETMALSAGETVAAVMVFRELFVMLSAFAGGLLIDRFGPYRVWTGGAVFLFLGSILVPVFGGNLYGMLAIRAFHGIGAGPIFATAPVVVAQWAPPHQRGVIIGVQGTFVSVGAAASMIFVPALFQSTGSWQTAMAGAGGFAVAALVVSLLVLRGPMPPVAVGRSSGPARFADRDRSLKSLFRLPVTWAAASCSFSFGWSIRIIHDIIPSYLTMEAPVGVGMGQMAAGQIISGVHVFSIVASLSSGFLMERCFKGRARGLVMIGFVLGALLWLAVAFPEQFSNRLILPLCMWVGGYAISLTSPLVLAFVSKGCPEDIMGKFSGVITGASALGTLSGLAAGSYTLHVTGMYQVVIILVSAGAFLGFLSGGFLTDPESDLRQRLTSSSQQV